MRCKYCGAKIDDDSIFCAACGRQVKGQRPIHQTLPREVTPRQKKSQSKSVTILIILCILVLLIAAIAIGILVHDHFAEKRINSLINLVQTGYLGEFTDITVKEILDTNYSTYDGSIWDGGTTDAGKTIIEAKYYDDTNGLEPTTIQFEMLNDECFRVSAFKSPLETIDQSTDLFAVLNNAYLVAYVGKNRTAIEDADLQLELLSRLNQISGSAAAYGASAAYAGNRGEICTLYGEKPLEVSATMLLDNYGKIDLSLLSDAAIDLLLAQPGKTAEAAATEPAPSETAPTETAPTPTNPPAEKKSLFVVTVKQSSGGIHIRSGPGTGYSTVGRLEAGETVIITEVQHDGSTQWGNIGSGWICLDYVDIGSQNSPTESSTGTSTSMTVCVDLTAGELKIRSGPDSSYSEVGRLTGGQIVTVTELRQTGSTQWGRIAQGWICMDYVNTVFNSSEERGNAERFVGKWGDEYSQRAFMTISHGEYGIFVIEIHWGSTAFSSNDWYAVGDYDASSDCIRYRDCRYVTSDSDGNGNFTYTTHYTDGQGTIIFHGKTLRWNDFKEDAGANCIFLPC